MDIANIISALIESALVLGLMAALWKKWTSHIKKNAENIEAIQKDYIKKNDLDKHEESIDAKLKEHKEDRQREFDQLLEMLSNNDKKTDRILEIVLKNGRTK